MTCVNFSERTRKEHPDARAARRLDLDLIGDCANDAQTEAASRQGRTLDKGAAVRDLYAQLPALETGEQLDVSVAARRVLCVACSAALAKASPAAVVISSRAEPSNASASKNARNARRIDATERARAGLRRRNSEAPITYRRIRRDSAARRRDLGKS